MKRILISFYILLVFCHAFSGAVHADNELSVKEILTNTDRARGNVGGIIWHVKIEAVEEGKSKYREMIVKVQDTKVLASFTNPPKMKGRLFLMLGQNMWFIRRGLQKPVSISPRQRLLGNAANGDIASTNYVEDYKAVLLSEEKVNDEDCFVLDLTAVNNKVTYDRIKYWVSKSRLVGVKAEFYTISGKLFKAAEFKYNNRIKIGDDIIPFVSELIIKDAIEKDNVTTLTYSNIKIKKIPRSTFNLNVLIR
ncbi:MAG: outer membrane lipoprotein-sorting protein [Candidatus Brocadiaceae bacterium]|nr:outer membrane lipoprotein-sorting protein [Candidatus Brocadiaceae bacterium]